MKILVKCVLVSTLLVGVVGCSSDSSAKAAEEARDKAADARVNAADADARVTAADAHVRAADAAVDAADADARVEALADKKSEDDVRTYQRRDVIPSGTPLKVVLIDALDSSTSAAGDRFLASLAEPVVIDGTTLLQKGAKIRGRVVGVEGAGRVKGRASISLALTDIMQGERMIAITTNSFAANSDSTQKRDAGVIAGGAGVGAVIGAIAGGKKGAGIGAITGGGAGTGIVLATKGEDIHFGPETRLTFTLANSVEM